MALKVRNSINNRLYYSFKKNLIQIFYFSFLLILNY